MALLDKLNKLAKNIEDKTGDAIELSKHSATITSSEHGFNSDIKKIGEFYYDFFINGGQVEPNILPVLQSAKAHQEAIAEAKSEIERINAENAAEREAAKAERAAAREAAKAEKEAARLAETENAEEAVVDEEPDAGTAEYAEGEPEADADNTTVVVEANICPSCGADVDPGAKFCGDCGYKMEV